MSNNNIIKFGVVGTNWITESFIKAGQLNKSFLLTAVYSRTAEKATLLATKYGASHTFTNLNDMARSPEIDAVYIASPNSLHYEQSLIFMKCGKHVLCEKPIASNTRELKKMFQTAKENNVLLMEAMKSITMPNFNSLENNLPKIGQVRRCFTNFSQYSSRYDRYKRGENPNTFNPNFSNGSLMDLGTYCIYPLIKIFGKPNKIISNCIKLDSGVDGLGSIIMAYEGMEALVMFSKISNSIYGSEIQGEQGCISIDRISNPTSIIVYNNQGECEDVTCDQIEETMFYEIEEFIKTINSKKIDSATNTHQLSLDVMEILDEVRDQIGVKYPADNNNIDSKI